MSKYVKYLGVLIDSHLTFSHHVNSISTKLSRAIGLLTKIRHYVMTATLRSIYFAIFPQYLHTVHKFGSKSKVDILPDWLPNRKCSRSCDTII